MARKIMELSLADPKGLIRESYAIEGITAGECRSIFLDWLLSLKPGVEPAEAARVMIATYALDRPDHPMSRVLEEGLAAPPQASRRGGRAGRLRSVDR